MRHRTNRLVYYILVAVFALNAAVASAACCLDLPPDTAELTPCHEVDVNKNEYNAEDGSECCTACLVIAEPIQSAQITEPLPNSGEVFLLAGYISTDKDPFFKPPIKHLF